MSFHNMGFPVDYKIRILLNQGTPKLKKPPPSLKESYRTKKAAQRNSENVLL